MKTMLEFPKERPSRMLSSTSRGYLAALEHLCHEMREDEIVQHMALAGGDRSVEEYNPKIAALGFANIQGAAFFYLGRDGMPCAAGGYGMDPYMPGVWQSWMVGTEKGWKEHWRDLTKGTRWLMSELLTGGARRLETTVIASRKEAQDWYTDFLGMKYEGVRRSYCASGEDVLLYSYTQEDWNGRWGQ